MKIKSLLLFAVSLLTLLVRVRADGFIVVSDVPVPVPHGHYSFAPLEVTRHLVDVKIAGQVATTSVDEEFFNPNDQRLEGTYMFPVPKGAHIDKFSMDIDGIMVDAELLAADKARKIYEEIVRKMRDPALLEYAGRDLFKMRIFPIEPHSRKQVKLTYTELLRADTGMVSYVYPLGTEKFSSQPIKNLSVKVDLQSDQPLASIYSPSHTVDVKRNGDKRATISFEAKNTRPDTDFQLIFTGGTKDVGLNLISTKPDGEDGYFMLLASPKVVLSGSKPAPKDVVFVLDTSGSMAGPKIKQAKKALDFCVESLNDDDRFEIIRFSTETEPLFDKLVPASDDNRKRASDFVGNLRAAGGTAIDEALQSAIKCRPKDDDRPFVVVFLTDGMPTVGLTNTDEIVKRAGKAGPNVRVFSFGIGLDVNTHFLDQLAQATRAFSQYVLPEEDIEVKVSNFFTRIKEPALTNVRLEFSGGARVSKMLPSELPDLFNGDQLVVSGRYTGSGEGEATLTGMAGGQEQKFTYKVRFEDRDTERDFIPRLWATRRVGFLLDEIRFHGENTELRDEVTELAREYGIVTPYTAYLIVEDEDRRNVPQAQRSMQEMGNDKGVRSTMSDAWLDLREKAAGKAAVEDAKSQNLLKNADSAQSAIGGGQEHNMAGLGARAGVSKSEASRLAQYTQQAKFVNGRAFFQNGNQWVDGNSQTLTNKVRVQFNTDAYFDLVGKHPEAAPWFALGPNLLVTLGGTLYEIYE